MEAAAWPGKSAGSATAGTSAAKLTEDELAVNSSEKLNSSDLEQWFPDFSVGLPRRNSVPLPLVLTQQLLWVWVGGSRGGVKSGHQCKIPGYWEPLGTSWERRTAGRGAETGSILKVAVALLVLFPVCFLWSPSPAELCSSSLPWPHPLPCCPVPVPATLSGSCCCSGSWPLLKLHIPFYFEAEAGVVPSQNKMSAFPTALLLTPVVLLGSAESSLNSFALGGPGHLPLFRAHNRTPNFTAVPGQREEKAGVVLRSVTRSGSCRRTAELMWARCGCMALGEGTLGWVLGSEGLCLWPEVSFFIVLFSLSVQKCNILFL